MTFQEASAFVMPFGKHKGRTLDEIARTDDGLRYLDWMIAGLESPDVRAAVETYLSDPTIAKELEALNEGDDA